MVTINLYSSTFFTWDSQTVQTRIRRRKKTFHQGLHCLLTERSIKIWIKMENTTNIPLKSEKDQSNG